ncbi:MAG: metallophosphoesterase [Nanoarchaeota archaeon]
MKYQQKPFELIGKTVYFLKEKVLVFGDMHLGYEYMLNEMGLNFPQQQIEQTFKEVEETIKTAMEMNGKLNKIVFLGDIKHYFAFNKGERNIVLNLLDLLEKYVKRDDIIMIKGNHEKFNLIKDKDFLDYYLYKDLAFIHGDIEITEVFSDKIKYILMGHLHPAITLRDPQKIRAEKYKCFLVGKYKNKNIIILPSFLPLVEGTSLNEHIDDGNCFIPEKNIKDFNVFVASENEVLDFGKLKKLSM